MGQGFSCECTCLRGGAIQYKSRQHLFISLQMEGIFTHKADVITLEESPLMSYVLLTLCNILKLLKLKHGNRLVFLWIPFKQDGFCLSNGIILQGVMFFMTAKHYLLVQLQKSVWSYLYLTIISRSLILSCLVYSSSSWHTVYKQIKLSSFSNYIDKN